MKRIYLYSLLLACLIVPDSYAKNITGTRSVRQMETLNRGLVGTAVSENEAFLSWRLLNSDAGKCTFDVYKKMDDGSYLKLNKQPLKKGTNFSDKTYKADKPVTYRVVANGNQQTKATNALEAGSQFTIPANSIGKNYLSIPLQTLDGHTPGDCSIGDLDGDGEFEIIVKQEMRPMDNSHSGLTGQTKLEAYKMNGEMLWRIDLGKNIREGAHYIPFLVYDFDGDGKAEIVCKTADGTVDGQGKIIGDSTADWRSQSKEAPQENNPAQDSLAQIRMDYWMKRMEPYREHFEDTPQSLRDSFMMEARQYGFFQRNRQSASGGHILSGPEYLTVFNGETGAAMVTKPYLPPRHPEKTDPTTAEMKAIWGDGNGNRSERYLACVAYLDGERPSIVMCRGYYTRSVLAAWDFRNGELKPRWVFDSEDPEHPENKPYGGQGNHNLSVADVDNDGCDEIIYGNMSVDHNGKGLYSTGIGHADAMHVSDLDPDRPGLEVFNSQERVGAYGMNFRNAATGEIYWHIQTDSAAVSTESKVQGPGRDVAFDIDPRYKGAECWVFGGGISGLYNCKGEKISDKTPASCNFAVWWDGDLLRELLDRNRIFKYNWEKDDLDILFTAEGCSSNNGTKSTPALSVDLYGDWREEIIFRTRDNRELRIFTTTIPTDYRFVSLLQDPVYRLGIAWQNVGYNIPPHVGFFFPVKVLRHK